MFKYFTSTNIFEGERSVAAARVQDSVQDIDTVLQAEQLPAW